MTRILLFFLCFTVPLIHTKFFDFLGFHTTLAVEGNFEFTKVMFFTSFTGLLSLSFLWDIWTKKHTLQLPQKLLYLSVWLLCYTLFSSLIGYDVFTSLFWSTDKGHSLLMFFDLFIIALILFQFPKSDIRKAVHISLISIFFVCFFALKEYFLPSFDYWELWLRAFGTLWHPNYLWALLVLSLPFLYRKNKYTPLVLFVVATLIFSKSLLGIALFLAYTIYFFWKKHISPLRFFWWGIIVWIIGIFALVYFFPEKLHSFLSRMYIWETVMHIIFSDIKTLLFWGGLETLQVHFSSFKVPEVYIYENFGYTADRAHNFFFSLWYNLGIIGVWIVGYILYYLFPFIQSQKKYMEVFILFFLFLTLHFASISLYIFVLIILVLALKKANLPTIKGNKYIVSLLLCISIIWSWIGIRSYIAEIYSYQSNYKTAYEYFPRDEYLLYNGVFEVKNIQSELYYTYQIYNLESVKENCYMLIHLYPSAENAFFCGEVLEKLWKNTDARDYYLLGLKKLPDLWNDDSIYWENYFIRNTISGNRFFSEKFSNLREILETIKTTQPSSQ